MVVAVVLGILVTPVLVVTAAWLGLFSVPATDTPSAWEEALAKHALHTALKRSAQGLAPPIADDEQTLLAGLKIYKNNCAGCHGEFGGVSQWGSKNFYPRVPQFSECPPLLSASEMFIAIRYGIRYRGMGAWNGMLGDEDIWRVALFLSRLRTLPPVVDAAWRKEMGASEGS